MKLVGKAIPVEEQLNALKRAGTSLVELQLVRNAIDTDFTRVTHVKGIDVVNIHTPLHMVLDNSKNWDVTVEYLGHQEQFDALYTTCKLGQRLAEYYKHDINVILHNGLSAEQWEFMPAVLNNIVDIFGKIIKEFSNINFYIENTQPTTFTDRKRNGCFFIRYSLYSEQVK